MQSTFLLQRELNREVFCGDNPSPSFYPHFHSHIEISLILSGEVETFINGQKKCLGAGELSVALSYDTHSYRTPVEAESIVLILPTDYFQEFLPLLSSRRLPSPFLNDPTVYQTVLHGMRGLMESGNEITKRGHLYTILGTVYDHMIPIETDAISVSHNATADILIYINEHIRDPLTLSSVSHAFGYHPAYFSRYFRQTFGTSFVRYLTMLRLREAILLLRAGKQTVTACALEAGFGSMRSFYRAFDEEFGCSPKEYLSRVEHGTDSD